MRMAQAGLPHIPYCGLPPSPIDLWWRWNIDPVLILVLIGVGIAYAAGTAQLRRQARAISGTRQALFYCGWALTAAALISPLCPLSVSLFSARVGQHMLITLVGAPLIAAGRPVTALSGLLSVSSQPRQLKSFSRSSLMSAAVFAALLWFWHMPYPYTLTFASTAIYWAMHVTLFGSALWLWTCLLASDTVNLVKAIGASIVSSVQMGFLGAVITFAPHPLYTPHLLTTAAWGITSLQDQQLGGAIMWVPGCGIFFALSILGLLLLLRTEGWQEQPATASMRTAEHGN